MEHWLLGIMVANQVAILIVTILTYHAAREARDLERNREKAEQEVILDSLDGVRIAMESNNKSEISEHQAQFTILKKISERTQFLQAIHIAGEAAMAQMAEAQRVEKDATNQAKHARDKLNSDGDGASI